MVEKKQMQSLLMATVPVQQMYQMEGQEMNRVLERVDLGAVYRSREPDKSGKFGECRLRSVRSKMDPSGAFYYADLVSSDGTNQERDVEEFLKTFIRVDE